MNPSRRHDIEDGELLLVKRKTIFCDSKGDKEWVQPGDVFVAIPTRLVEGTKVDGSGRAVVHADRGVGRLYIWTTDESQMPCITVEVTSRTE